jgi:N-acetylglucosamine-6-phosphate deacetylase
LRLGVEAALVDGQFVSGDVEVEGGRIVRCGLAGPNGRGLAVPGFVDLQVNGFGGVDFLDADADGYRRAGEALLETGVTAYLPTLITSPEEQVLAALREVPVDSDYPRILGVHLEGPFLSPRRLGTHLATARRDPDLELLDRLLDGGPVRLMTLAPELPGAGPLIERLLERGVTVSLGHTDATAEQANLAFDLGVRTVTHLFNAMRPFLHRDPGVAGAALARDDVIVQLILDGVHLASETVRVAWRAAPQRVALVTDSVTAAGASDGAYSFGSLDIEVHEGAVRGPDGVLAGSVLTMIEAVRNLHALGVPLADAVEAATAVPARILGQPEIGRLDVGLPADIVILDDRVEIERVLVAGSVHVAV